MQLLDIDRIEAGVDWVTWSAREHERPKEAYAIGLDLIDREERRGEKVEPLSRGGYQGWKTTHVEAGYRDTGALVRISSTVASGWWTTLVGAGGHPTRLDLQATLKLSSSQPSLGRSFTRVPLNSDSIPPSARRKRVTSCSTGAFISTLGARQSERYVRVYDKGVESKTHAPGVLWRIEAELKGSAAEHHWNQLSSATSPPSYCCSQACSSLVQLGGWLPWPICSCPEAAAPIAQNGRTIQKELEYLRRFVVPMLQRLTAAGMGPMARTILADGFRAPPDRRIPPGLLDPPNTQV